MFLEKKNIYSALLFETIVKISKSMVLMLTNHWILHFGLKKENKKMKTNYNKEKNVFESKIKPHMQTYTGIVVVAVILVLVYYYYSTI